MITHRTIQRFLMYGTLFLVGVAALFVVTTDASEPNLARSVYSGLAGGGIITTLAWWLAGRGQA